MRVYRCRFTISCFLAVGLVLSGNLLEARTVDLMPEPTAEAAYLLPISSALDAGDLPRAEQLTRARLAEVPEDSVAWEQEQPLL